MMKETSVSCKKNASNAALLPPYRDDADVKLIRADADGLLFSPDWVSSLVLVEVHPETATKEGTLASLVPVLDHLAALGVNGIWLTPIYEKGPGGNGYGNMGPHTLEPAVTGTDDVEEGWRRAAAFVAEAHKRNIRVLLDIISWGCIHASPLISEHPDWFRGEAWGGAAFDWENDEFRAWFIDVCIRNILVTHADGYRCDCEPMYSGYRVFAEIRTRLLALGRKIAVIAEESSERRATYDCEQDGVTGWIDWSRGQQYQHPRTYFLEPGCDIVSCIREGTLHGDAAAQRNGVSGRNQYYTYCVSNHDFQYSVTNRNRLVIGYQAIFAPYIPLWYLGAEFGMTAEKKVIYFVPVDWTLLDLPENREFLEDIRRYLAVRRLYPEIFEYFPLDHRESNIAPLESDVPLRAYARYRNGQAVLIVPNPGKEAREITVRGTFADLCMDGASALPNLLEEGKEVPFTAGNGAFSFRIKVEGEHLAVLALS